MLVYPLEGDFFEAGCNGSWRSHVNDFRGDRLKTRVEMLGRFDDKQVFLMDVDAKVAKDLWAKHLAAFTINDDIDALTL